MSRADPSARVPRRILLYGATGAGKTTAALRLGARLGLPVTLADEIGWLPAWKPRALDEQIALAEEAAGRDEWVFDSAYGTWKDQVVSRAELVIGLDYPRWFSLQRVTRRALHRAVTGEELFAGNRETWRQLLSKDSIVAWHFRSWRRKRTTMRGWEADPYAPPVLLFHRARDLEQWVAQLAPS